MNLDETFMHEQVPLRMQALIVSTIKTAYAEAEKLIRSSPILSVRSAEDQRGRVIAWAVDLEFEKLVKSGRWPCSYRWAPFVRPTGHYLEFTLADAVMTISQVEVASQQPRNVMFRANKRHSNQLWLDLPEFEEENQEAELPPPHILLVHGYQTLRFIHLGFPNEEHSAGYIYHTKNLLKLPHEVLFPHAPAENTDKEPDVTPKDDEDEKWRRESGQ